VIISSPEKLAFSTSAVWSEQRRYATFYLEKPTVPTFSAHYKLYSLKNSFNTALFIEFCYLVCFEIYC